MAQELIFRTLDGVTSISIDFINNISDGTPGYYLSAKSKAINFGTPKLTDIGKSRKKSKEPVKDSHWTNRYPEVELFIKGSSLDDMRDKYRVLVEIIQSSMWEMAYNGGGDTEATRYYDCFSVIDIPSVIAGETWDNYIYRISLKVEAKPFARRAAVDLPRNLCIDGNMGNDASGSGIPDSWADRDSGVDPPAHKDVVENEWAETRVLTGGSTSGEWAGLESPAIPVVAGEGYSFAIKYYTSSTFNDILSAQAFVLFNDGGLTSRSLLYTEVPVTAETESTILNFIAPVGATSCTLRTEIICDGGGSSFGSLFLQDFLAVEGADIPRGADGNVLYYDSEISLSPGTLKIKNLPGDVPAQTILKQMQPDDTVSRSPMFIFGMVYKDDIGVIDASNNNKGFIYNWKGLVDTEAYGGVCSEVQAHTSELKLSLGGMSGRFLMVLNLKTDSSTFDTDTFKINIYSDLNSTGVPYSPYTFTPFVGLAANKWTGPTIFGTVDIPLGADPDWEDWITGAFPTNSLGIESKSGTGTGWRVDTAVFFPVKNNLFRCDKIAKSGLHGIIHDSISRMAGNYWEYNSPSSFSVGGNDTYDYIWYWGTYQEYFDNVISVDMADLPAGGTFTNLTGGVTYSSTSGITRKFNLPVGTTEFFGDYSAPNISFTLDASINKGALPQSYLPGVFYPYPVIENKFISFIGDFVDTATKQFDYTGTLLSIRYVPRFLE